MGTVQAQAIMSLDGYVAKQDNTIGQLFDWLQNGDIAVPTPAGDFTVHLTEASARHWTEWVGSLGALSAPEVSLGNPTTCVQGDRVTHLVFPVLR